MTRPRSVLAALALATLVACTPRSDATALSGNVQCSAAASSRWSPSSGRFRATASRGASEDDWFGGLGGIAFADSVLYVPDPSQGAIFVLDPDLRLRRRFARTGSGPGELEEAWAPLLRIASPDWAGIRGDTLLVYDGRRLSRFSLDGAFIDHVRRAGDLERLPNNEWRIRYTAAGLLYPIGGYRSLESLTSDDVTWRLRRLHDGRTTAVIDLPLPALPRPGGVRMNSRRQAEPHWDVHEDCAVATDGATPWLYRAALDGSARDRLPLEMPDPVLSAAELEEERRMMGMAGGGVAVPEPTALRRVARLIVDPDGFAWVLPVQPNIIRSTALEVHLVSLATGAVEIDTVPAFPKAFGAPGVFYAQTRGPDQEILLTRFERADGAH
jgi:hypothetical protein